MKKYVFYLLTLSLFALVSCGSKKSTEHHSDIPMKEKATQSYDSLRAQKLGADQYGMKKYVMAFLKKGPNRDVDEKTRNELQAAHMENIGRMAEAGKLVLAGPFFDNGDLRGIYIFNTRSIAEAEELTNSDPAIKAGSLVMELKEWYGSAALMEVNEIHKAIAKINI